MQRAKHSQEDLLGEIEGFFAVAEQMGCETEHHAMMLEHQRRVRGVVAGQAALDERSFAGGDLRRPSYGFGRLDGKISCHGGYPRNIAGSDRLDPERPEMFRF